MYKFYYLLSKIFFDKNVIAVIIMVISTLLNIYSEKHEDDTLFIVSGITFFIGMIIL